MRNSRFAEGFIEGKGEKEKRTVVDRGVQKAGVSAAAA